MEPASNKSLADLRILLVEDEFFIMLDLLQTLESAGAVVTTATSVAESEPLSDQSFDVALLDVRLPDGEIFPVAKQLVGKNVPIVFHSGHAQLETVSDDFPDAVVLSKPVQAEVLVSALHEQAVTRSMQE